MLIITSVYILESSKDSCNISPKVEKLSIKNFMTVNPPKSNANEMSNAVQTDSNQDSNQRTADVTPRRVGFVTLQPTIERKVVDQQQTLNSIPLTSSPSNTTTPVAMATVPLTTQPRRVSFTTLQPGASVVANETANHVHTQNIGAFMQPQSTAPPAPIQQPRRVSFTTLKPLQSTTTSDRSANTSSSHTQDTSSTNNGPGVALNQPHTVGMVTKDSPLSPTIPQNSVPQVLAPNTHPLPRRVGFVTLKPPQSSAISPKSSPSNLPVANQNGPNLSVPSEGRSCTGDIVPGTLERQVKPPVPLEPKVIIID